MACLLVGNFAAVIQLHTDKKITSFLFDLGDDKKDGIGTGIGIGIAICVFVFLTFKGISYF